MKKRILAIFLVVAMAASVFAGVIASADALEDALVYSQDYEGEISGWADSSNVTLVADPFDADNQVMKVTGEWASFVSENLTASTNGTTYTIVFRVYGDCAFFGLTQDQAFWQKQVGICGASGEVYSDVVNDKWHTYVYTYKNTWGRTRLCGQVQSQPVLSQAFYVDDVKIYEGDFYDEILGITPTPTPNDETTVVTPGLDNDSDDVTGILCIGDSITHGNGLESSYFTSYRYPLWKKLIDAGVSFEMVGPREGNFNKNCTFEEYKGQTFNNKHYAQYGIKLEQMKGTIGTDCANVDFDVAIINLGTNDRKTGNNTEIAWTNENIPNWLAEMTNTLRTVNPNVTVFLAGMIDSLPGTLNGYIEAKAEEISTTESPVYYIPAPTGWIADPNNANTTTLDWCHPNEKGCQMMADTYYEALMENYFNSESTSEPSDERIVYEEDFEGDSSSIEFKTGFSAYEPDGFEVGIVEDPTNASNKVYRVTDISWNYLTSSTFVEELDPTKEYTMKVDLLGDASWIGLTEDEYWNAKYHIAGSNESYEDDYILPMGLSSTWRTAVFTFTGLSKIKFAAMVQSSFGLMDANFYLDNITIYEGDVVDEVKPPEPIPTSHPDLIESPHDYPEDYDKTWTIYKEGATSVAVTFSEDTYVEDDYDFITIYDGDDEVYGVYTSDELAGETILVPGDTVKIRLESDEDFCYYGFAVTNVEAYYNGEIPDWWTPTPEPTPTPTILVNPEISPEVVAPGTKVTLPKNSLVTDGGFEKARYDDPSYPLYTYVDAFTATDDYGYSTERFADYVQIMDDKDFAVEGEKSIILQPYEAATIAMPDLYKYRGGELVFEYYIRVEDDTPFLTFGYFEDRSIIEETYEDEYGDEYNLYKQISLFTNIATNLDEEVDTTDNIYRDNWVKMTERMTIPDDLGSDNECVICFTSIGNAIYLDAVSCVLYDKDGKEIRYVNGVLLDPTPEPTPTPTPTATPTTTPVVSATPSPTATATTTVLPSNKPVKKSVKFTKKSVKIKRGKKVTLKVKITGAKKAKFSVDKKGKKVVKLMKKKAKSVVVKGKKKGKAVIMAKAAGKKAVCTVKVK